ncbi:hypothetical protein P3X46_015979 [Hevea brasiliensis]|uniref:t-SNARE coiled-coil homology domain-containing protein n=1 Tax=Hevea brasiliensis TaxID=3981 RepID=A0ABQ9LZ11_HEVBR|nr:hypothetical protein P3X46_015979 [Hevea brasiliensis]
MTKSFLSYMEPKRQSQKDLELEVDMESGCLNPADESNFSQFFQDVAAIKDEMEEINNLLFDLLLRGLRDRMETDSVAVLRKAKIIKARLESLDQSNEINPRISELYKEGSLVDRTRISVTNGLRVKLREMMNKFQFLREKIFIRLQRGTQRGGGEVKIFSGKAGVDVKGKEMHKVLMEIQRSLTKLHQVFLDMAVIVETQREKMDDIEENVANAGHFHQRRNQQSLPCQSDKGEEEGLELLVLGCDGDHTFGLYRFNVSFMRDY